MGIDDLISECNELTAKLGGRPRASAVEEDRLNVALNEAERETTSATHIEFRVSKQGNVLIRERWESYDEIWSDGVLINVPFRVWRLALPWVSERLS